MTQLSEPLPPKASSRKALNVLWVLALALVFVLGLAIRFYDLNDLPLDFNPTRQLHSMLIARGIYYQNLTSAPAWQRDLAVQQWKGEGLIEPQIMEHLAAYTYDLLGEHLWIPRVYAIFFWVLGGLALYWLARDMTSRAGGMIALIFYLIVPFGAIASRAFQPDPLMVCTLIFALWAVYHWYRTPGWKWTIIAGLLSGLTIYVKSTAVFFIGGALIGLMLGGVGLKKAVLNPKVWVLALLAVVPYALYTYYGVYVIKLLQSQFSLRFFPQMWIDPLFYLRWNGEIRGAVGTEMFLAALVGTFLFSTKAKRSIMLGLWGGYFVYGVLFSYYTGSHDYYQEPLIPIVALGLAALTDVVFQRISEVKPGTWAYVAITGAVLFGVTITAWDVRNTLKRVTYFQEAPYWAALGNELHGDFDRGSQPGLWLSPGILGLADAR